MQIVFREFTNQTSAPPLPGELHVRAAPDAGGDRVGLTSKALREGPPGFPTGLGPIQCVVVPADPTLDDMLAAQVLMEQLAGQTFPADVPLAHYVAALARGHHPAVDVLPEELIEGVFAHYRHAAGDPLTRDDRAATFLALWPKLAALLRPALLDPTIDPFSQLLLTNRPDFQVERLFLRNDRTVYEQDVRDGQRWLVRLPHRNGEFPALVLKEPQSVLFKFWARSDPDAVGVPPTKAGYHFLVVLWGEKDWWFTTDPVNRYDIRSLAEALQTAEVKKTPGRVDSEGKDADPWYNGKRFNFTIVRPPNGGTALTAAEVLSVVRQWGQARPMIDAVPASVPVPNGHRPRRWERAVAAVGLVAAVVAGVLLLRPPPPPKPTPTPGPEEKVEFVRYEAGLHWRKTSKLQDLRKQAFGSKTLNLLPEKNDQGKDIRQEVVQLKPLSDPGRPLLIWLQATRTKPPDGITIKTPGGEIMTVESWAGPNDGIWLTPPLHCPISVVDPKVTVAVPNAGSEKYGLDLVWRTNPHDIHLHFMAVGVGEYETAGVASIKACTNDAEELTKAFGKMDGGLFTRVVSAPALVKNATRSKIIARLKAFKEEVKKDRGTADKGNAPLQLAVLAFSGHGDVEDGAFVFLPSNYTAGDSSTGVSWGDFQDNLAGLGCPTVIIFNSCKSGKVVEQVASKGVKKSFAAKHPTGGPGPDDDVLSKVVSDFKNVTHEPFIIAATASDASAYVSKDQKHGALTQAVLEVLAGQAEGGKNGLFTLADLLKYTEERVPQLANQVPTIWTPGGGQPRAIPIAYPPRKK